MNRHICAALAIVAIAGPASSDEFTDVIDSALSAYNEGDISIAIEELDYAGKLLKELKSASLSQYLPEPLEGWTRSEADPNSGGMAIAFGGGTAAAASYSNGAEELTIALVANSPMVSGLGAMITGMSSLTGGKPIRIQRTQFANNDGELQGVVDGKVLVSVSGEASLENKTSFLEAMDMRALRDF